MESQSLVSVSTKFLQKTSKPNESSLFCRAESPLFTVNHRREVCCHLHPGKDKSKKKFWQLGKIVSSGNMTTFWLMILKTQQSNDCLPSWRSYLWLLKSWEGGSQKIHPCHFVPTLTGTSWDKRCIEEQHCHILRTLSEVSWYFEGFSYIRTCHLAWQSYEVITIETQLSWACYFWRRVLKIKISSTTSLIEQSFAEDI